MWEIDILEYVGREPDIIFTSLHRTVMEIQSTTRIEDIEEGIISMLWIGLKIK
jgi:hypothetical protein